jgi:hypothetical protein
MYYVYVTMYYVYVYYTITMYYVYVYYTITMYYVYVTMCSHGTLYDYICVHRMHSPIIINSLYYRIS